MGDSRAQRLAYSGVCKAEALLEIYGDVGAIGHLQRGSSTCLSSRLQARTILVEIDWLRFTRF